MPKRYPPTTHIGVKLDRADLGQLDALAKSTGVTRSDVLRRGIRVQWALSNADLDPDTLNADVLGALAYIAIRTGASVSETLAALVHDAPAAAELATTVLDKWR